MRRSAHDPAWATLMDDMKAMMFLIRKYQTQSIREAVKIITKGDHYSQRYSTLVVTFMLGNQHPITQRDLLELIDKGEHRTRIWCNGCRKNTENNQEGDCAICKFSRPNNQTKWKES